MSAVRTHAAVRSAPAVRRARQGRRAKRLLAGFTVLAGLLVVGASRVHVNASWSDDAWAYLLLPMGMPAKGDVVIFEPPQALGTEVPYLKTVRGVPGERLSVDSDRGVWIGGEYLGRAKPFALEGRALQPIEPVTIPPAHYYLHADHIDSHDSRYAEVGLVPGERILGRAVPLPDVPWLGLEGPLVKPAASVRDRDASRPLLGRDGTMRTLGEMCGGRVIAAIWLASVLDASMPVTAKDLGVWGEVWPIEESDLLEQVGTFLEEMESSGELARMNEEARRRAIERLEAPDPVPGIAPATETRSWLHDPAVVVQEDFAGPGGIVVAAAGTRIEPLEHRPMTQTLLFIDGTRSAEVEWALAQVAPTRIVLLAGRPFDLARTHARAFYSIRGARLRPGSD